VWADFRSLIYWSWRGCWALCVHLSCDE
jgi:hypothetical protein